MGDRAAGGRYKVDQRAALFGARFGGAKSSGSPGGGAEAVARSVQSAEVIEQQNDEQLAELGAKVAELKDITKGIAREARDSHGLLGALGQSFDKASTLMRGTWDRLTEVTKRKQGRMCMTVSACLGLFLAIYLLSNAGAQELRTEGDGTLRLSQNATMP